MRRGFAAAAVMVLVLLSGVLLSVLLGTGPAARDNPAAAAAPTSPTPSGRRTPAPVDPGADGSAGAAGVAGNQQAPVAGQTEDTNLGVSTGESWAAALAVLGAIILGSGVLWLVKRAHDLQTRLAGQAAAAGTPVSVVIAAAAGPDRSSEAAGPPAYLELSGPDRLRVGAEGEFVVRNASPEAVWTVQGLDAFEQRKKDAWTLVIVPREVGPEAAVRVTDGDATLIKPVQIEPAAAEAPAASPSFAIRLVLRSWGLVVVAIAVVFGAVALGLTDHLDGGNFVALVAPLAALLGVTAAASGGDRGDSSSSGSAG